MVWKQDLAKLKQQIKESGEPSPKAQPPKPIPKPVAAGNIEEEDALFLNAMGNRPATITKGKLPLASGSEPETPNPLAALPSEPTVDFLAAMGGMKGLKTLEPVAPSAPESTRTLVPNLELAPLSEVEAPAPENTPADGAGEEAEPAWTGPTLIHLAAGMAVEVEGSLDLRGHTTLDAMERFRERLQDGVFLGWRTLHVTLGAAEELQAAFHDFLRGGEARPISRYAQAPIPMGGREAWILYYVSPGGH